jgi:hypothetical protein
MEAQATATVKEALAALYHHPDDAIRTAADRWLQEFQHTLDAWQVRRCLGSILIQYLAEQPSREDHGIGSPRRCDFRVGGCELESAWVLIWGHSCGIGLNWRKNLGSGLASMIGL